MTDSTPATAAVNPHAYSPAVAVSAEGSRVGIITCLRCGSALLLSMEADSIGLHDSWHRAQDRMEADRAR